jgi:hypothetical protein
LQLVAVVLSERLAEQEGSGRGIEDTKCDGTNSKEESFRQSTKKVFLLHL